MRQERKLEKAIQRDGEQSQSDILDELKRRYPQYTKQADSKQATVKKRRIAVFSSLAAVAACLAIILPCSLLLPNHQPNGGGSENYYCAIGQYEKIASEYTLREYSEIHNSNISYFDWYDTAEDCFTECFIRIKSKKTLGIQESAYNPETDEFIELSVTKSNVYLGGLESYFQSCVNEQVVFNCLVRWNVIIDYSICIFEHNGYRYFIKIDGGQDENRLFELVEDLLQNK